MKLSLELSVHAYKGAHEFARVLPIVCDVSSVASLRFDDEVNIYLLRGFDPQQSYFISDLIGLVTIIVFFSLLFF